MPVSLTKLLQPSALLALLVVTALLSESGNLRAQELSTTAAEATSQDEVELRFRDYEAKIQSILKTRLNEEKAFVTSVMEKVRAGEIPEKMV